MLYRVFLKKIFCSLGIFCAPSLCFAAIDTKWSNSSSPAAAEKNYALVAQGPVVPGSKIKAYKYKYRNGLTAIILPDSRNPVAKIQFILNAGSDREVRGESGLAHFFEHNMFRKAKGFPEGHYDRVLSSIGGSANAATSNSFVTYFSVFPSPALNTMLELEAERFLNLEPVDPYFTTEKGAVISERRMRYENDPVALGEEVLRSVIERGTSREWLTIGSQEDVAHMTIDSVQKFYKTFYVPNNTILFIGSPFAHEDIAQRIERYFGAWQEKPLPPHFPLPSDYVSRDYKKEFICGTAITIKNYALTYPSVELNYKDLLYAQAFETLLDLHLEGEFQYRLLKKKLATAFNFGKVYWENTVSPISVEFSLTQEQDWEKVKEFWFQAIAEMLQRPFDKKVIDILVKQTVVDAARMVNKMTSISTNLVYSEMFFKNFLQSNEDEKIIRSMTEKEFREWILRNLNADKMFISGIVPKNKDVVDCENFVKHFYQTNAK